MKKIVAAFDGLRFSESTLQYAIFLARQYNAQVTGVFLHEATRIGYALYETIERQSVSGGNIFAEIDKSDALTINKSIGIFEAACLEANLSYTVHHDRKNAVKELIHETVYADLLVLDAGETFSYIEMNLPGWFIKNILHEAHCPVIIVPKKFNPIKKIVLLYDGKPSSVHAIKMLNYILPEMNGLPIELLCAKHDTASLHLPDNKLLKEWMKVHYPGIVYKVIKGDEKELVGMLSIEDPGTLVVTGAYHRSNLSMWLHPSLADFLVRETKAPVFISHA